MRKITNLSLALIVTPILFSGCVQEKVANVSPTEHKSNNLNILANNTQQLPNLETNTTLHLLPELPPESMELVELAEIIKPEDYDKYIEVLEEDDASEEVIQQENLVVEEPESTLDKLVQFTKNLIQGEPTPPKATVATSSDWEVTKEDEIIATAVAFLDTKYVWAATGPSAFDCSGFTRYVYKENGMSLPRYSGNQAKVGIKVTFDELQKGDLVFFDTEKHYSKKVNHVGIYMGNGKFIHASSAKKKVVITSFRKKHFYKDRFLWGQRIIDEGAKYSAL